MTGWREATVMISPAELQSHQRGPYLRCVDAYLETVLIALLAFMPFALGAAQPWSHSLVMDGCLALCVGLLLRSFSSDSKPWRWGWALLPILLFMALVVIQLVPLPGSWIKILSPNTAARRSELLSDSPLAIGSLRRFPISFYPLATEHDLRLILCTSVVFITVWTVVRSRAQVLRLLIAIACIGAAVATVAALQDLSGATAIYWNITTPAGIANAGPFVLYNNYAQFMNLSIGAGIALLLYLLDKSSAGKSGSRSERSRSRSISRHAPTAQPVQKWQIIGLTTFIIIAACTVLLSGSRGGTLSLIVAFFSLIVLLGRKRSMKRQSWILLMVGGAIFGSLLYVGFDAVCDRLATLRNSQDPTSGRLQSFKDTASIWQKFPIFGTGLGTHQYVYPAYDRSTDPNLAEQADGDYIQALEEVGAAGLFLILCFVAFIGWRFAAIVSAESQSSKSVDVRGMTTLAYGLGFGLLAVILHSFVDFGQHLPAIGCLSAALCGLVFSVHSSLRAVPVHAGNSDSIDVDIRPPQSTLRAKLATCVVAFALTVAGAWGCWTAEHGRRAEASAAQAADYAVSLSENRWKGTQEEYVQLLTAARDAADAEPRDVTNQYWLNCYRWQAISRPTDSSATGIELTNQDIGFARRIVADLDRSRMLCPVYGPTLAVMGQIEYFALAENDLAAKHVALACKLWPNHPAVCLAAGSISAAEARWDSAMTYFRRCLLLDSSLYPQVLQILLIEHHRPDLAVAVSDNDPSRLLEVIRYLPKSDSQSNTLAATARAKAIATLDQRCASPDAPAWILAQTAYLHRENNNKNLAIGLFRRALSIDYGQVGWRLGLADLLKSDGQIAQAAHEAKICLRLHPQLPEAVQFIAQLNALPGVHLDELDP